jgi:hypothetical protein
MMSRPSAATGTFNAVEHVGSLLRYYHQEGSPNGEALSDKFFDLRDRTTNLQFAFA